MKHSPYKKLEGYKTEHDITNDDIAKCLDISETAVINKNTGKSDYYISQVQKLKSDLGIPISVFLS